MSETPMAQANTPKFDAANWYWQLGDDESRFWSTAAAAYVDAGDPALADFLAAGGVVSRAFEEADLCEYLIDRFPAGAPRPLRERKRQAAEAHHASLFAGGYVVPTGPLAGRRLQTATPSNISDWTLSWTKYHLLVAAGQGATVGALFRDAANVSTEITYAQGAAALDGMLAWGETLRRRLWVIKDLIDAAEDDEALEVIDVTSGYPDE